MLAERFYIFSHPSMTQHIETRAGIVAADYSAIEEDGRFSEY
jgi:hypothetical protein